MASDEMASEEVDSENILSLVLWNTIHCSVLWSEGKGKITPVAQYDLLKGGDTYTSAINSSGLVGVTLPGCLRGATYFFFVCVSYPFRLAIILGGQMLW